MTQYSDGRKLEYAAANDLRANGYEVMRTAGSRGAADLIAIKPREILFVQCKLDGRIAPPERHKLIKLTDYLDNSVPVLAYWHKPGRAARQVAYRELTGLDTDHWWTVWTPDHALEAS